MTIDETIKTIGAATQHKVVRVFLPRAIAKAALQYVPGVHKLMRIPPAAVDYFNHPTSYDTANARAALAAAGIAVPRLRDYVENLVAFVRAHPEIGWAAMVRSRCYIQLSTRRPATRVKCFTLLVTSVSSSASACAAMRASNSPIGEPRCARPLATTPK